MVSRQIPSATVAFSTTVKSWMRAAGGVGMGMSLLSLCDRAARGRRARRPGSPARAHRIEG